LIAEIDAAEMVHRTSYRTRQGKLMSDMRHIGMPIPQRLRAVDVALTEQIVEERFDNLPI